MAAPAAVASLECEKRSLSRRGSSPSAGSADAEKKKATRVARGSPPSPLDYSVGKDVTFFSPLPPVLLSLSLGGAGVVPHVEPVNNKVCVLPFLA
jgi:hypothetical protein